MTAQPDSLPLPDPAQGLLAVRVTCRRCRRPLHDPESRARRIGRDCEHQTPQARRYEVDQETLPGL